VAHRLDEALGAVGLLALEGVGGAEVEGLEVGLDLVAQVLGVRRDDLLRRGAMLLPADPA
jgi:hypothetical protein